MAVDEAAELLLFADAHSYPQLKEMAMDVVVAKLQEVMATKGWKRVAESPALLQECLQDATTGGSSAAAAASDDPKSMRVSELRRTLGEPRPRSRRAAGAAGEAVAAGGRAYAEAGANVIGRVSGVEW